MIEDSSRRPANQCGAGVRVQAAQLETRYAGQGAFDRVVHAGGDHNAGALGGEPPSNEAECEQRLGICVLRVIDHADSRLIRSRTCEQSEKPQPHERRLGRQPLFDARCDPQRGLLRRRELIDVLDERPAEPLEGTVSDSGFHLDALRAQDPKSVLLAQGGFHE